MKSYLVEIDYPRKEEKVSKEIQEKCTTEKFAFILHKNITIKFDLFPDNLYLSVWCFSHGDNFVNQNNDIVSNTTQNMEEVSSSFPLTNANGPEEKDLQSFLKDISINNINRLSIG